MDVVKFLGDFFLSAWIWNITFDWFHPIITGITMFLLLRFTMRRKRIKSIAISIGAQVFAFALLSVIVVGGLVCCWEWSYAPTDAHEAIKLLSIAYASISLGLIYTLFHMIFFSIGFLLWRYNLIAFVVLSLISNGVGIMLSYMMIRMVELWYYVA